MAYQNFNHLIKKSASDKILHDKAFNISKSLIYDGYQHRLASLVCKSFDKKASGGAIKNEIMSNKEFAEELPKPIIRKF